MAIHVSSILRELSADPLLRRIEVVIREVGKGPCYLVGGYLRDRLFGQEPLERDIDLASPWEPRESAEALARRLGGSVAPLDPWMCRVVFDVEGIPWQIDLSRFKGPTIEADLRARDFTIDAFGVPLGGPGPLVLLDPLGGLKDLQAGIIRMASPSTFEDDPLRLLRAIRLACQFGFSIEEETVQAIQERAFLLRGVAGERIKVELFKLLSVPRSAPFVALLDQARVLPVLVPEVEAMKVFPWGGPHRSLWFHALETLRALEELVLNLETVLPQHAPWLKERLQEELEEKVSRFGLLKLVALFHEAGRPSAQEVADEEEPSPDPLRGRAKVLRHLFETLRLGRRAAIFGERLFLGHPQFLALSRGGGTPRARYRLFRDFKAVVPEALLCSLAHIRVATGEDRLDVIRDERCLGEMLDDFRTRFQAVEAAPLLRGGDLVERFQLAPGPFVGFILEKVQEAQAVGEVTDREEAFAFVEANLPKWRVGMPEGRGAEGGPSVQKRLDKGGRAVYGKNGS